MMRMAVLTRTNININVKHICATDYQPTLRHVHLVLTFNYNSPCKHVTLARASSLERQQERRPKGSYR
eukprot:scaffold116102_cov36-Prasinocladus_malaysianus.AAC.1